MKQRIKAAFLSLALIFSFIISTALFTYAEESFDDLLKEREDAASAKNSQDKKKVSISDFTDVSKKDWFYDNLKYLVENGLINGKSDTSFEPYGDFSYAECSVVIVRYLNLEKEAKARQKEILKRNPEMKNIWYAGYFEVLGILGLFEDYDVFEMDDDKIVSINTQSASMPIERYKFAESISQSFELSSNLKARNVFYELGGNGFEFIVGTRYESEYLELYEEEIRDFEDIPASSREDVLKAYYNGIFCGDAEGCFYPNAKLSRAEMAKVLSVIQNPDLRLRLIDEGYARELDEDDYHVDGFGVKSCDFDVWQDLLEHESANLSLQDGEIIYTPSFETISGYAIDVYLYEKDGEEYTLNCEWSLRSRDEDGIHFDGQDARVLFVLRNTYEKGRVEGVYNVTIQDGEITQSYANIREMPIYAEDNTLAYFLYNKQFFCL